MESVSGCHLCGLEVKLVKAPAEISSKYDLHLKQGLHFLYKKLKAEELWSSLESKLAEQRFCSSCIKLLENIHHILLEIESSKTKLKSKVSNAKRKILESAKYDSSPFRKRLIDHTTNTTTMSHKEVDDDDDDDLSDMDVDVEKSADSDLQLSSLQLVNKAKAKAPENSSIIKEEIIMENSAKLLQAQVITIIKAQNKSASNEPKIMPPIVDAVPSSLPNLSVDSEKEKNIKSTFSDIANQILDAGNESRVVQFHCSHCKQSFLKSEFLSVHLQKRHNTTLSASVIANEVKPAQANGLRIGGRKTFQITDLEKCNSANSLKAKEELETLMFSQTMLNREHRCNICNLRHNTQESLIQHFKDNHPTSKPLSCPKENCSTIGFWKRSELRKHFIRVHVRSLVNETLPKNNSIVKAASSKSIKVSKVIKPSPAKISSTPQKPSHSLQSKPKEVRKDRVLKPACPICSHRFPSTSLALHVLSHEEPEMKKCYSCNTCNKSFAFQINLDTHMEYHKLESEESNFCCQPCEIVFDSEKLLKHHVGLKHKEKMLICKFESNNKICNRKYIDEFKFKLHEMCHSGVFVCEFCDKKFTMKNRLLDHINCIHKGQKPYKCNEKDCGKSFGYNTSLFNHTRHVHLKQIRKKQKLYPWNWNFRKEMSICEVCGKSVKKIYLNRHKRIHEEASSSKISSTTTIINPEKLVCRICGKNNSSQTGLIEHMKSNNCFLRLAKEPESEAETTAKDTPKRKKTLLLFPKSDDAYKCRICNLHHKTVETLQEHFRECHEGLKPFICQFDKCRKSGWLRADIRKHIDRVHGDRTLFPLKYSCPICSQKRETPADIKVHMMIHTNERPFQCPLAHCSLAFRSKKGLADHINCIHERKSEFKCTYCGKSYAYRSVLSSHIRNLHTGKYACNICPQKRNSQAGIDSHLRQHEMKTQSLKKAEVVGQSIIVTPDVPLSQPTPCSSNAAVVTTVTNDTDTLLTPAEAIFVGYVNSNAI